MRSKKVVQVDFVAVTLNFRFFAQWSPIDAALVEHLGKMVCGDITE